MMGWDCFQERQFPFLFVISFKKQQQSIHHIQPQMPASSSQDLSQAIAALQISLSILLLYYKSYIKSLLLVLFVYLFYKLGNLSVRDERLQQKQQLAQLIQRRIAVRVEIPPKINKLRQLTFTVIIFTAILLIIEAFAYYFRVKFFKRNWGTILMLTLGSCISALTLIQIYKHILQRKFHQNDHLESTISKHLTTFQTSLGPKVNKLLKHHLCKQRISNMNSSLYSLTCSKPDCQQLRTLYKQRVEATEALVNSVVGFEWCSVCRKRKAFDEYLGFEFRQYQERHQSEEEEVRHKIAYLVQGIDRIHHWLSVTAPCNCSKLYWAQSTQKILHYKNTLKNTNVRIALLEKKHSD